MTAAVMSIHQSKMPGYDKNNAINLDEMHSLTRYCLSITSNCSGSFCFALLSYFLFSLSIAFALNILLSVFSPEAQDKMPLDRSRSNSGI